MLLTRRTLLETTGLAGTARALGGWPGRGMAQGLKTILAAHGVLTFVYGQHPVA